mmetsp:Transcript_7958/g.18153  ORF Transcript_7958/g.18153 Transcript_7958/m.18153 type:complete len:153 (-) Transcript_7958:143-601(-)
MGLLNLLGISKNGNTAAAQPTAAEAPQAKSTMDIVQGGLAHKGVITTSNDDYDFEDIETTKLRHGIQPRQQKKQVAKHSWGEIALGTAQSCAVMGCFGALMGLSVGAITGPIFAPPGHRLPVTIALMKRQSVWFGVIFGGGGGIVSAVRKYA